MNGKIKLSRWDMLLVKRHNKQQKAWCYSKVKELLEKIACVNKAALISLTYV